MLIDTSNGELSLSARKLWIEIQKTDKYLSEKNCRFLRGSCGLKFSSAVENKTEEASLSARKLWIEICICESGCKSNRSLSARKLWIEIHMRL